MNANDNGASTGTIDPIDPAIPDWLFPTFAREISLCDLPIPLIMVEDAGVTHVLSVAIGERNYARWIVHEIHSWDGPRVIELTCATPVTEVLDTWVKHPRARALIGLAGFDVLWRQTGFAKGEIDSAHLSLLEAIRPA